MSQSAPERLPDWPPLARVTFSAALLARFDLDAAPAATEAASDTAEQARRAFVADELRDRPIRLYDTRLLGMQPQFRDAHFDTWREARARGRLCLLATDDPDVLAIVDRVLRFEDGRLAVAAGQP